MDDTISYTFKIKDFTPKSLPFGRLLSYYAEIKEMIGVADNLHLVDVSESSHASSFAVSTNIEPRLKNRLDEINAGTAPTRATKAYNNINGMLREDKTSATFFGENSQNVLLFPGRNLDQPVQYRIREAATFAGELYYIAGTSDGANIRIRTDPYGVVFCTTTLKLAKEFREFLFETVKVSGRGLWVKSEDGEWDVDDFSITDFTPTQKETLRVAVDRLRKLEINWPEDPIGEIYKIDENGG